MKQTTKNEGKDEKRKATHTEPHTVNDGLGSLDPDVDKNAIRLSNNS